MNIKDAFRRIKSNVIKETEKPVEITLYWLKQKWKYNRFQHDLLNIIGA